MPILSQWQGYFNLKVLKFNLWVNRTPLGKITEVSFSSHEIWLAYSYSESTQLAILVYRSLNTTDAIAIAIVDRIAGYMILTAKIPEFRRVFLHPWQEKFYWEKVVAQIIEELDNGL